MVFGRGCDYCLTTDGGAVGSGGFSGRSTRRSTSEDGGTVRPSSQCRYRIGAAVALALSPVLAVAPDAGAQEDGFRRGEAEAHAESFTLNIKQGNANIGFTYGRSRSGYQDRTASAEAHAIDLGVLPTLFATEQCDGSTPPMNPDTLPPRTRVDSTEEAAPRSRRVEVRIPGSDGGPHGPVAGTQDAIATPQPLSRGLTTSVDTDIFLLALDGGRTEVTSRLDGQVRSAVAVSTADELRVFGGLFTFEQPRWEARVESGDRVVNEGAFTFERATVLGVERTPADALRDFAEFEWGLEQLLAPLGVELELPAVEVTEGRVKVSPMSFKVVDPPFGRQVLAPFFGSMQSVREAESRRLVEQDCTNALKITLLDVVLGIAAGSGAIEVLAGGVEAFTADTDFSVPPLEPLPLGAPALPMPPPPPLDLGADLDLAPTPVPAPAVPAAPVAQEVAGRTEEPEGDEQAFLPATPSSRFEDSTKGAAAVAVGSAGLAGALALAFGERFRARRRARRTT
jgi:hypothetical protein